MLKNKKTSLTHTYTQTVASKVQRKTMMKYLTSLRIKEMQMNNNDQSSLILQINVPKQALIYSIDRVEVEKCFLEKILALCFQNYKMHIPSGLATPQLGIYPRKIIRYVQNACMHAKSLQQCPTLCDLMDCSLPGSSVCGIFQGRILEWVAMPSSRGSSQPRY